MSPNCTRLESPNSAYFRGIARIPCSVAVASSPFSKLQLAVLPPLVPSRRSRAQLAHLRYADLDPSWPSDHHGTLVDARVHMGPPGSCSPRSPHRIHRGGPALIGRQDCVPASSASLWQIAVFPKTSRQPTCLRGEDSSSNRSRCGQC